MVSWTKGFQFCSYLQCNAFQGPNFIAPICFCIFFRHQSAQACAMRMLEKRNAWKKTCNKTWELNGFDGILCLCLVESFWRAPPYRIGAPDRRQFLGTIKLQPSRSTQNLTCFWHFSFFLKHVEARCKKPSNPIKFHQIPTYHHISFHIISSHISPL